MHLQIRVNPAASPPDVHKLLGRLAEGGVNLVAIGGSNVEFGGELAIVPQDGHEDATYAVLDKFKYGYRVLSVDGDDGLALCEVPNKVGGLHGCLEDLARDNRARGRIIRDIVIGVPDDTMRARQVVPVQVYSQSGSNPAGPGGETAS
ncbi:MAG TPA: hypothetical protein VFJ71_12975 [Candidatus Limnocylindrales bacterium]|nr:hypothetical protein [Candidatus Limnocylindrales bacterium]